MHSRARLIAFCGVDGAGKTSMMLRVQQTGIFSNAVFVKKRHRKNIELVKRLHACSDTKKYDWTTGDLVKLAAIATSFDFLNHYECNIEPHLFRDTTVISERYFPCYAAYHLAAGTQIDPWLLFQNVARPDLVIYLDVDIEALPARYRQRGGMKDDESVELMRALAVAYETVLAGLACPVVRIDNTKSFDEAFEGVLRALSTQRLA